MRRSATAICLLLAVVSVAGAQTTDRSKFTASAPTLSTATAQVLAANDLRNYLSITNDDAAIQVYCAIDVPAVLNTGIRVNATTTVTFASKVPMGIVNCIAASATPKVIVIEGTK